MRNAVHSSDIDVDLRDQLSAAQQAIEHHRHQLAKQKSYIEQLEEFIRNLRNKLFGASSEAQDTLQSGLFDEGEGEPIDAPDTSAQTVTVAAHERQPRKPERIPPDLPREEIVHDLNDADKVCPHDGSALRLIGAETSEQLDIVPAQIKVLRHVRHKYACSYCEQAVRACTVPNG
jgi:transposase